MSAPAPAQQVEILPDSRKAANSTNPAAVIQRARSVLRGAGRIPVTLGAVFLLLSMGIATHTLWSAADPETGLLRTLSFGTPRLQDGHLWTFLTGAFVLPRPEFYLIIAVLLVVGLGSFERRVGHARAAVTLLGTQLFGTLAAAALLWPFDNGSWPWASALANQVDLGLSAGALGVAGAATALLSDIWRRRLRAVGVTYLSVVVLKSGLLWDLEHLLAFSAGMLAGPRLAGRAPLPIHLPRISSIRIRVAVSLLFSSLAVANLVETMYPGQGGMFGDGIATHPPMHGMALIVGELVVALLVADALRRGRAAAWWLATIGAAVVLINSLVNTRGALRIADAVCAGAVVAVLLAYRNAWRWRTPDGFALKSLRRIGTAVLAFGTAFVLAFWLLRNNFDPAPQFLDAVRETMTRFTFSPGPLRPHGGLTKAVIGTLSVGWAVTLICLLVPWLYADRGPGAGRRDILGGLLRRYGGGSLGWMRTWPAFTTWTTRDGQVAISYCVVGTVAIAIGDPVGPEARFAEAVRGFRQFCQYAGWTPCWFAATPSLVASAAGWKSIQIGEDTVIDLATMEFVGKSWQDVRTAKNRAARENITMLTGRLADFPEELRAKIERISCEWVSQKALPEMGFTLGTVRHALDPEMRTHVAVDASGSVQGVTTWLPVHQDGAVVGWTLDLMRRRPDGFRPVMEYLIAESALLFKQEGYRTVSLSVAPLARRTQITGRRTILDRSLDLLSGLLEPTYGFQSLLAFKAKFHPEFRPVYLVYSGPAELVAISLAIGRAYLPNLDTRQAATLVRGLRRPHHRAPTAAQ